MPFTQQPTVPPWVKWNICVIPKRFLLGCYNSVFNYAWCRNTVSVLLTCRHFLGGSDGRIGKKKKRKPSSFPLSWTKESSALNWASWSKGSRAFTPMQTLLPWWAGCKTDCLCWFRAGIMSLNVIVVFGKRRSATLVNIKARRIPRCGTRQEKLSILFVLNTD